MSHAAICTVCKTRSGQPYRWRENCEHCAEWIAVKHEVETGHKVELRITAEPTIANLKRDIRTANLITRRNGW